MLLKFFKTVADPTDEMRVKDEQLAFENPTFSGKRVVDMVYKETELKYQSIFIVCIILFSFTIHFLISIFGLIILRSTSRNEGSINP